MEEAGAVIVGILLGIGIWVLGVFLIIVNGNLMIDSGQLDFWPVVGVLVGLGISGLPLAVLGNLNG